MQRIRDFDGDACIEVLRMLMQYSGKRYLPMREVLKPYQYWVTLGIVIKSQEEPHVLDILRNLSYRPYDIDPRHVSAPPLFTELEIKSLEAALQISPESPSDEPKPAEPWKRVIETDDEWRSNPNSTVDSDIAHCGRTAKRQTESATL